MLIRFVAIASAVLAFAHPAFPMGATDTYVGVKSGLSIAEFGGSDAGTTDSRLGFTGGAFVHTDFSERFGTRIEVLYTMKGAGFEGTIFGTQFDATLKLDYVELPILFVGHVPASASGTFDVFAGPVLGINVNAEAEVESGGTAASVDYGDETQDFEFGLAFGAGMTFYSDSISLVFDARYCLGLTTIDEATGGQTEEFDVKNRSFAFSLGVGFPIGDGE